MYDQVMVKRFRKKIYGKISRSVCIQKKNKIEIQKKNKIEKI